MTIATQIGIAAAGNYNFFNFLTVALTLLLLDDDAIRALTFWRRRHAASIVPRESKVVRAGAAVVRIASFGTILACLALLPMCVRVTETGSLNEWSSWLLMQPWIGPWATVEYRLELAFDVAAFQSLVVATVPFMMAWLGVLLVWHVVTALITATCDRTPRCISVSRAFSVLNVVLLSTSAAALFCVGCIPFLNGIDARNGTLVSRFVPDLVQRVYTRVQPLSIVNAYGLFRVMTTDRLELVVQGSRDGAEDSWRDYELPFQPRDLSRAPPVVAPHQPRLDWQMWFASLGSYQQQPWLVHLAIKLLRGERDVTDALIARNPFADAPPPKFVRVRGAQYRFAFETDDVIENRSQESRKQDGVLPPRRWWRIVANTTRDYLPPLALDNVSLRQFARQMGWERSLKGKRSSSTASSDRNGEDGGTRFTMFGLDAYGIYASARSVDSACAWSRASAHFVMADSSVACLFGALLLLLGCAWEASCGRRRMVRESGGVRTVDRASIGATRAKKEQ